MAKIFRYGLTRKEWEDLRRLVIARDGECFCGEGEPLYVNHIIPYEISFDNDPGNLEALCKRHNAKLGYIRGRDPYFVLKIFELDEVNVVDAHINRAFTTVRENG